VTSDLISDAAHMWHILYPKKNFFSVDYETQRKWIKMAKEAKNYFANKYEEDYNLDSWRD
jgi:hypothetical protein